MEKSNTNGFITKRDKNIIKWITLCKAISINKWSKFRQKSCKEKHMMAHSEGNIEYLGKYHTVEKSIHTTYL